jgi:uncharacterized protein (TIGR00255 family)
MNSMTAFSRLQVSIDSLLMTWEIKSVNHRFLDQFYRLPEQFRHIESVLRQEISKVLQRGRIEISMQLKQHSTQLASFNTELIADIMRLSEEISNKFQIPNDLTTSQCFKLPNIWSSADLTLSEQQTQLVLESFKEALAHLVTCRRQEGEVISKLLLDRVEKLHESVEEIKLLSKNSQQDLKEKLLQKIKVLYTGTFDEQRLEQELVIQLMRLDIAEELDRLDAHLNEIRRVLNEDKNNGRRLDFLVQECHRETNTIGSKTDSKKISQLAIDMKVLIEQMREQIQNVE